MPLHCRRWDCPSCGPRQKRKLTRRLAKGTPDALLTLTVNPRAHVDPTAAFRSTSVAVHALTKRIRRWLRGSPFEYALVWERTKAGWPHAHLLIRSAFIPQPLLSRWWGELTGAPIVDIRRVQSRQQVAAYVSKYLTKAPAAPPGSKRFRTTRHYAEVDRPPKLRTLIDFGPIHISTASLSDHLADALAQGASPSPIVGSVYLWQTGPPFLSPQRA